MKKDLSKGLLDGVPIALGYFSVSFGFGILAVGKRIPALFALLISATNLTSAGQAAGVEVIAAGGPLLEMALTQFIINLRYSLMALSLTQKLDSSFTTPKRLFLSFGLTDEIYAVASSQSGSISPAYLFGLICLPFFGWTGGTLFGALASSFLPSVLANNMGIMLYGMFLAIVIPPAKKIKPIRAAVILSAGISLLLKFFLPFISAGFAIIISALASAAFCAYRFPIHKEEEA